MGTWAQLDTDQGPGSQGTALEHRRQFAALCHEMLVFRNHLDSVLGAMDAPGGGNALVGSLTPATPAPQATPQDTEIPSPGSPPGAVAVDKAVWAAINTDMHTLQTTINTLMDATLTTQLGGLIGPTAGV